MAKRSGKRPPSQKPASRPPIKPPVRIDRPVSSRPSNSPDRGRPPVGRKPVHPHGRRRGASNVHITLTVITFALLTTYLLGYVFAFMNKPSIGVETVTYGSIDVPQLFSGIIVREEKVVNSTMAGQPYFNYSENERTKKGSVVVSVKNVAATSVIEKQIEDIDKDILQTQKSRSDLSMFKDDILDIEENMKKTVDSYTYKFITGNISEVYDLKSQLQTQIDKRNTIWLTENVQSLSDLSTAKGQYEQQLSDSMEKVTTEESGILSFWVDGLEETLTPDSLNTITEERTKMKVTPEQLSRSAPVEAGVPLFKLVTSNIWRIAAYVPNDVASAWKVGEMKTVISTISEEEKSVPVEVEILTPGTGSTFVVFKTDRSLIDFLPVRTLEFQVQSDIYKGIKIPNEAIVEKTLLKIPTGCIVESVGIKGVIKKISEEGTGDFTQIQVIKTDSEQGYTYVLQEFGTLKVGDVVLQGTGAEAQEVTLSEVVTTKGVYVANAGVADFVSIEIMGQNSDYTVVEASVSGYGLKVYDRIVSDAKSIKAGDAIY